jgi:hypothetical protein
MLFHTLIDFNSEDVMYKLILFYLLPCKHLMKSQIQTLKQNSYEINGSNAQAFLSLSTDFNNIELNNSNINSKSNNLNVICQKDSTPFSKWFHSL